MVEIPIERFLGKKYKLSQSDNFEEFMKASGVNFMVRKLANNISPVIELKKEGDEYVLYSSSTFKNIIIRFRSGEEFQTTTPDGRKATSCLTVDGTSIKEVQIYDDGKVAHIDRFFTDEEMKMILNLDDIVCTRIYSLVK